MPTRHNLGHNRPPPLGGYAKSSGWPIDASSLILASKKSKFSEEQIVRILKEVEAGAKAGETCRKHGISELTYYAWKDQVRRDGRVTAAAPEGCRS